MVLPLLEPEVVGTGWVDEELFIAGYGAAQAIPGPVFTFSSYLGAVMTPEPNGIPGAALALVALFLPSLLMVMATLPFFSALRTHTGVQAAFERSQRGGDRDPSWWFSTTLCGPTPSVSLRTLRWPWSPSGFWHSGRSRPGWS